MNTRLSTREAKAILLTLFGGRDGDFRAWIMSKHDELVHLVSLHSDPRERAVDILGSNEAIESASAYFRERAAKAVPGEAMPSVDGPSSSSTSTMPPTERISVSAMLRALAEDVDCGRISSVALVSIRAGGTYDDWAAGSPHGLIGALTVLISKITSEILAGRTR